MSYFEVMKNKEKIEVIIHKFFERERKNKRRKRERNETEMRLRRMGSDSERGRGREKRTHRNYDEKQAP